jgi:AAHS family 4-hydroxybenzoate transporter-like MFS transporter
VTFCLFRFLTGIGLGILLPLGVTYVNEFAPRRIKHTFSTWGWGLGFSLGGASAAVVGVFLTPTLGWEALYYVAALFVFLAIACQAALPESIQFQVLSPRYRRTTLATWGAAFFVLFGVYGLTGWVPASMLARGDTFAASFGYGALILMMKLPVRGRGGLLHSWGSGRAQ